MKTLIYGAGLLGQKALTILRKRGELEIVGFIDDDPITEDSEVNGVKVLGQGRDLRRFKGAGIDSICIAEFDGETRIEIARLCARIGFDIADAISPDASIDAKATLGRGNIISEKVTIGQGAIVGDNCFIAPGVEIGMGESIEDGSNVQLFELDPV